MKTIMPFESLTKNQWQNLAIFALMVFYLIQIVIEIFWRNTFGNLGIDFASYWSAGYIANHYGIAKAYDLNLMKQIQFQLLPGSAKQALVNVLPTPYLAVFLLPFMLLSLVQPVAASWIWFWLNLIVFLLYMHYFVLRSTGQHPQTRLLAMILVSFPVFLNLFNGQVNVWLAICVGEFLRAAIAGKPFRSGLWLGGLLLKPQCLILLIPALILQRSWKAASGLIVSGIGIIISSLMLGGFAGFVQLANIWLGYAGTVPTSDPQLMMNWRMIGTYLGAATEPKIGWFVYLIGLIITILVTLYLWIQPITPNSPSFVIAVMGTLAATNMVSWHSHVHMAMIMIPALVYLHLTLGQLFDGKLEWWVFLPAGLYGLGLALAAVIRVGNMPAESYAISDLLRSIGLFGQNLYLLGWAVWQSRNLVKNLDHQESHNNNN